jgi:hypothetical protein
MVSAEHSRPYGTKPQGTSILMQASDVYWDFINQKIRLNIGCFVR